MTTFENTDTHRVCGTCGELKPFNQFYKDGTNGVGNTKYRRDCKDCYKRARMLESRMKGGRRR